MQYLHAKGEHHKGNVSSLQAKQQGLRRKAFECQLKLVKLHATIITMPVRADGGSLLTQGPSQILIHHPSVPACTNHATVVCPACCIKMGTDICRLVTVICKLVTIFSNMSTNLFGCCCFHSNGCLARPHRQRFHLVRAQVLSPCKHPLMSSSPAKMHCTGNFASLTLLFRRMLLANPPLSLPPTVIAFGMSPSRTSPPTP